MKFNLKHAIIAILTIALIYVVVQYRNIVTDLSSIPSRRHPELKAVKKKQGMDLVEGEGAVDVVLTGTPEAAEAVVDFEGGRQ